MTIIGTNTTQPALPVAVPPPPSQAQVAPDTPPQPLVQAPAAFSDWLLQTSRGPVINYDNLDPLGSAQPNNTIQLYRINNLFGFTQTSESWVHAILYLHLVEVQKSLWTQFTATPGQDQSQSAFATFCGAAEPTKGRHGTGSGQQHTLGGAIDIEYMRSPYIPLRDGAGNINFDHDSYDGFAAASAAGQSALGAEGPDANDATALKSDKRNANAAAMQSVYALIAKPCVVLWDKISGGTNAAICKPQGQVPNGGGLDTAGPGGGDPYVDNIMAFNAAVIAYFAQGANAADVVTAKYGMPVGSVTYVKGGPPWTLAAAQRDPTQGICGVSSLVAKAMLRGISSVASADSYPVRWSVFVFGADLMHFDVEHAPTGWGRVPVKAVQAAGVEVEKYFTGSNPGSVPWG